MPPARNQWTSKGCLGVVLRATRGDRNNIPYIAPPPPPPFLRLAPNRHYLVVKGDYKGSSRKGFGEMLAYRYILSIYLTPTLNS